MELETIKNKQSFFLFKKIGKMLGKKNDNKLINQLLKNGYAVSVLDLIEGGYTLNTIQENKLILMLNSHCEYDYNIYNNLLEKNYQNIDKYIANSIMHNIKKFFENCQYEESLTKSAKKIIIEGNQRNNLVKKWYNSKIENKELNSLFFNAWKNNINSLEEKLNYLSLKGKEFRGYDSIYAYINGALFQPLKELNFDLLEDVDKNELKICFNLLQKIRRTSRLNKDGNYFFNENLQHIKNYLDKPSFEQKQINTEISSKNIINVSYKDMCIFIEENQKLIKNDKIIQNIKDIKEKYDTIKKDNEMINKDQIFLINNLFYKRLPQLIEQYISITIEARETIKNKKNKTATQIMIEGIENISSILITFEQLINEKKLSELSVSKRYFNEIKKGI